MSGGAAFDIVILGAGGHARVVLAGLRALGLRPVGCIAPAAPDAAWPADGGRWLGGDEALMTLNPAAVRLVNGVGTVAAEQPRRGAFERAAALGFDFRSVIHPAAVVDATAMVSAGAQVMAGAVIQCGARIGVNAVVNTGAVLDHDGHVDDHAQVAPGAVLAGGVTVGEGAYVGAGATVLQGVSVGAGAVIGAGAVVRSDVLARQVVGGVPARPLSPRRKG